MELEDIIKGQREVYLRQLVEFYKSKGTGAKELLLELNEEEQEKTFKLYRLDHYEQGKPTELAPESYLTHPPLKYSLGDLKIELNPFYWHGCDFITEGKNLTWNWLISWTKNWIDEKDTNPIDGFGFSNVIHSVTRPLKNNTESYSFSVDFGTAPEVCFMGLIKEIEIQKIRKLRIGSFEMMS